jgi:hypothetical protein
MNVKRNPAYVIDIIRLGWEERKRGRDGVNASRRTAHLLLSWHPG